MPHWKITMEFDCFRGGWSESFYMESADVPTVVGRIQPVVFARMNMSPPPVIMIGVRIAQYPEPPNFLPTPRVGEFLPVNAPGQMTVPLLPNNQDTLAMKYVYIARTSSGSRRFVSVGGLMDIQTQFSATNGGPQVGAFLSATANTYKAVLVTAAVQVWGDIAPTQNGYTWMPVQGLQGFGPNATQIIFTIPPGHGLVVGDYVTFGRVKQVLFPKLNGNWPVLASTTSTITIGYYNNYPAVLSTITGKLRLRKLGKRYDTIAGLTFDGLRAHSYGRPFAERRGRAKAVSFRL